MLHLADSRHVRKKVDERNCPIIKSSAVIGLFEHNLYLVCVPTKMLSMFEYFIVIKAPIIPHFKVLKVLTCHS